MLVPLPKYGKVCRLGPPCGPCPQRSSCGGAGGRSGGGCERSVYACKTLVQQQERQSWLGSWAA